MTFIQIWWLCVHWLPVTKALKKVILSTVRIDQSMAVRVDMSKYFVISSKLFAIIFTVYNFYTI